MKKLVDMVIKDQQRQPKDIKTQFKVENLPAASGDYALLRQVWENLISNAIKYSSKKEKPVVSIGAKELKGEVLYFIKDNGAGFDMENADKLFKVFSRMHTNDEFEGNGVGLAIVERIVSKHGGRIWAESESGRGSVFHFTLPMQ